MKDEVISPKAYKPFTKIITELVRERKKHPKGTFDNLMWKLIANALYGSTATGVGGKRKFDAQTKTTKVMEGGELTNPLICGYITAFVRVVIGECLNNIKDMGGKAVSVTTDGFITDVINLEEKLLNLPLNKTFFFRLFKTFREVISENPDEKALEIKNEEGGLTQEGGEEKTKEMGLLS
ncbi:hypothetical protein GGS23DRAFT_591650 [Durotheca rogersii]|uniref:uncharacterized protein n=1 Tax=Durotheca rogersii TaxID=419775 RepID=UPI00221F038C|nr:uncharacterized protein GGS23DRAFT_591649 [Durotheca rogersii]XP_051366896.1 uncharacterized protein GGS23DRAFT_591650 [Durotheca rogersii]KAI5849677.1 hypothetical protein GGS23DRAFT_591649 [Durotheca rogersii]KAI5849678.1 hypothetical protein GGS23DRAFT_591650 [Durotheca rogersii]